MLGEWLPDELPLSIKQYQIFDCLAQDSNLDTKISTDILQFVLYYIYCLVSNRQGVRIAGGIGKKINSQPSLE